MRVGLLLPPISELNICRILGRSDVYVMRDDPEFIAAESICPTYFASFLVWKLCSVNKDVSIFSPEVDTPGF